MMYPSHKHDAVVLGIIFVVAAVCIFVATIWAIDVPQSTCARGSVEQLFTPCKVM